MIHEENKDLGRALLQHPQHDREYEVSVLVIDDEDICRFTNIVHLKEQFSKIRDYDLNIKEASNIDEAINLLRQEPFHVILLDRDLGPTSPGSDQLVDGIEYIPAILNLQPSAQIIVVTGHDDTRLAVRAMQLGANGYLVKKDTKDYAEYRNTQILTALKRSKLELDRLREKNKGDQFPKTYICNSPAMKRLDYQLHNLAELSKPVLLLGESGLGKTATAKRLSSIRSEILEQPRRPFLNVNIATIDKNLASSILFGHEKGAFTGANKMKQGLFELSNGGDLFLDEIGEADLNLQAKLLKVIEEGEFQRVGGDTTLKTSARVIFATNKNLQKMAKEGTFREDLYARISTFTIELPSLEDRKEDIADICRVLIDKMCSENSTKSFSYSDLPDDLKDYLHRDDVPLNIRGLENDLCRLMIMCPTDSSGKINFVPWKSILGISKRSIFRTNSPQQYIQLSHLKELPTKLVTEDFGGLKEITTLLEKKIISEAIDHFNTGKEAADFLDITPSALTRKMSRFNITKRSGKKKKGGQYE